MNPILEDEEFLADLADESLSQRQIAGKWGISRSSAHKYRQRLAEGDLSDRRFGQNSTESSTDVVTGREETAFDSSTGKREFNAIRTRPVTAEDVREWLRSTGDDPEDWNYSFRSIAYADDKFSNKMSAWPKSGKDAPKMPDIQEMLDAIEGYAPERLDWTATSGDAFIICPADLQAGKGDYGLDHHDLTERVMWSWARAEAFCREFRPSEIVIAELGDSVENLNNTSSQRGTNTLALTEQIRLARRLLLEGVKRLAPLSPKLTYAAVPSNHGSVRVGFKSPENHVLDDYGIEIAEQIRDVVENAPALFNVEVIVPDLPDESLCIEVAGTGVGMAHGHQANSADQLGKFWAGQSHGRMPLHGADIALFGHHHSLRVQQSGDARWLMVSPSSDNGSSWFAAKTGERSTAGMLSFTVRDGAWANLAIM